MEINIVEEKKYLRVKLVGHFSDQTDFDMLKNCVDKYLDSFSSIVIDISRVTFLSSRGLGIFITLSRICQEKKIDCILFCPREEILDTIQISGIDLVVDVTDNERYIENSFR